MRTHPHPLTADLPPLPVPDLDSSLQQFSAAAQAVYTPQEMGDVEQAIKTFRNGPADQLQQQLETTAEHMAQWGSNWMAETWLEGYLKNREPLPITDNVTFQLNLPTQATGTARIVELLQRIGTIHVLQAQQQTPADVDVRGQRLAMDAWADFNGGIRVPTTNVDVWAQAESTAVHRTVGLFYRGRLWEILLTGDRGKLLATPQLRAAVEHVLAQQESATQPFANPSVIGSAVLAEHTAWQSPHNQAVHERLANMLFTLTIDPEATQDVETLQRWAFQPGASWVYKPLSYFAALNTSMLAVGVEHSVIDGGTLCGAVARMQEVDPAHLDTQTDSTVGLPTEMVWQQFAVDVEQYQHRADQLRAKHVIVHHEQPLPFPISADVRAQLVLMIAQHLTYGHIRSHYQACDMRHFRAGRTESIRPVTVAARNFVAELVTGQPTETTFNEAVAAHRQWVKTAKTGQAFDRHLMMLQQLEQTSRGETSQLFTDYTRVQENFLSTSTMGGPDVILRYMYAPTTTGGYGVNYTSTSTSTQYLCTWVDGTPRAETFCKNLTIAGDLLYEFIDSLARVSITK